MIQPVVERDAFRDMWRSLHSTDRKYVRFLVQHQTPADNPDLAALVVGFVRWRRSRLPREMAMTLSVGLAIVLASAIWAPPGVAGSALVSICISYPLMFSMAVSQLKKAERLNTQVLQRSGAVVPPSAPRATADTDERRSWR